RRRARARHPRRRHLHGLQDQQLRGGPAAGAGQRALHPGGRRHAEPGDDAAAHGRRGGAVPRAQRAARTALQHRVRASRRHRRAAAERGPRRVRAALRGRIHLPRRRARDRGRREGAAALDRAMTLPPTGGEAALSHVRSALLGQRYSIESEPPVATAEQLRNVDPAVFEQPFEAGYTSRGDVPETAAALADQVVQSTDADTGYDTAIAFQDYFRNSFAYSLTVNSPPGEDPLESFLEDRVGYCEQFAASFALMMTSQGYPARVVIGFTPGQQDGEEWSVTS